MTDGWAAAGRPAALDDLDGTGVDILRTRMAVVGREV